MGSVTEGELRDLSAQATLALLERIHELEAEIERLKTEPHGDGYDCSNGCAHCCTMHRCDCYN